MTERIVVLGAGYAGATAIQRLDAEEDEDFDVVWISDTSFHFALHEAHRVISEPGKRNELTVDVDEISNSRFVQATVTGIDPDSERVELSDGRQISYDHLLVGIGSRTATYDIPGVANYAYSLKSRSDAIRIARDVRELILNSSYETPEQIVVAGAGLSGIQTAGEIAKLRNEKGGALDVTLVEAESMIYPSGTKPVQKKLLKLLRDAGVESRVRMPIQKVTSDKVVTKQGNIPYDLLVWTTGITGPEELEQSSIPTKAGRVTVTNTLQSDEYDNLYGIGDVALHQSNVRPSAQTAIQSGAAGANNVIRQLKGKPQQDWSYTDRGTLISVSDGAVAYGIPFSPVEAFTGPVAEMLKKGVSEAWLKSLTASRSYYELLPDKLSLGENNPVLDY